MMQLFEENIQFVLQSSDGLLGQFIQKKAEEVRDLTRQDAQRIMHRLPPDKMQEVLNAIQVEMEGTQARIGFVNIGEQAVAYLSHKSTLPEEEHQLTHGSLQKVFTE